MLLSAASERAAKNRSANVSNCQCRTPSICASSSTEPGCTRAISKITVFDIRTPRAIPRASAASFRTTLRRLAISSTAGGARRGPEGPLG